MRNLYRLLRDRERTAIECSPFGSYRLCRRFRMAINDPADNGEWIFVTAQGIGARREIANELGEA